MSTVSAFIKLASVSAYLDSSFWSLDLTRALVGFFVAPTFLTSSFAFCYLVWVAGADRGLPRSDPRDTPFPPNDLNELFDSSLGALLELPAPP